ncbi:MAG: PAS domain S-box protein [Flavobacteriales bacterium]|nr:PAS domain S-box protein [Flavobacteriales bacterium]
MTINSLRLELEALISEDSGLGKLLYSNFSGGFWYWDIDQPNNVFCEDRFWLKLGFDPQQIEDHHKTLKSVVSGSEWEILVSQLKEIDHNEGIFPENIIRVQNKKENDLWFICRGFTVNQENQLPPRALFQLVDVSRLKRRELEATSVLSSYRALVDAKSLFFIKTDLEGNYTYANKCFLDHYGYDWKELAGNSSLITIHPDDHLKTFQIVEKCFQIPNTPHPVVIRKPYSDGRVKAERFEFYGVTDEEGNMLEIACVGTSVSDLLEKTAEVQKLLEVQTDKNQRLQQHSYITSHNIRNSVANIKGLLDVMESHPEGNYN